MSQWILIDAQDQSVGRLATKIATILRGKDDPAFAPNRDPKRHVVVINCDGLPISDRRGEESVYRHTGYIGNLKEMKKKDLARTTLLERAVRGMLPRNTLGSTIFKRLHCYAGTEHPYNGQING